MKAYGNCSTKSGVTHYAMLSGGIDVRFSNGTTYRFTDESCGAQAVSQMKRLARNGSGLSGFIGTMAPAHQKKWR